MVPIDQQLGLVIPRTENEWLTALMDCELIKTMLLDATVLSTIFHKRWINWDFEDSRFCGLTPRQQSINGKNNVLTVIKHI